MKGLLLLSGGIDSASLLAVYKKDIAGTIFFNYNSNHNLIEEQYAAKLASKFEKTFLSVDVSSAFQYHKSALLDNTIDSDAKRSIVPFRNGILISIAVGIAESNDMDTVFIGSHKDDQEIYPDCRSDFIHFMGKAILNGTVKKIRLYAPFEHNTKRQIAKYGWINKLQFEDTYSCYKGNIVHCGGCPACLARQYALFGFDPTEYEDRIPITA